MNRKQGYYNIPRFVGENYGETDQVVCIPVFVPAGEEYKQQLLTLMNVAGIKSSWVTDTEEQRSARAEIWQLAYRKTLECMMSGFSCEAMLEAIEALQEGMAQVIERVESIEQFSLRSEGAQKTRFADPASQASCDEPRVQAGAERLVRYMADYIVDLMQIASASEATDDLEEWAAIIGAVPVFETLPFDDMLLFVKAVFENQQEDFEAAVTEEWIVDAADILHCDIMGNGCTLDTQTLTAWLLGLVAAFPSNVAATVFQRFGEATNPSILNQANQFLNQILNARDNGTIFEFFGTLINAYRAGTQDESFLYTACSDCETTRLPAYPPQDTWLYSTLARGYQGDWAVLNGNNRITIDILSVREITAVRLFAWTQYPITEAWTISIDGGEPEELLKTWQGWGIPFVAECILAEPTEGQEIRIDMPGVSYVVVQWVEWESCAII